MAAKKKKEVKKAGTPLPKRSLRDKAEEQLARSGEISSDLKGQAPEHELKVHQIELETQAEELRRAQLALEVSRDKYLDLYEFAPVGYLTLTYNALVSDVNLTAATLLGVERNRLVRARFRKFIAPLDLDGWDRYFTNVLKHEDKLTATLMLTRGDGSTFPARLESIRLTDRRDGTTTIRVAISDITDLRQVEEALRESKRELSAIILGSPIPQFVIDSNHRVIHWNKAIEDYSGIPAKEIIGTNQHWKAFYRKERPCMADLLIDGEIDRIQQWYEGKYAKSKFIDGGYEATDFFPHMGRSGTWLYFTAAPIRDSEGSVIGAVETLEDITERKRAEEALRDANKKLNLLSSITRHDINNQLLALNGFLDLLQSEAQNPALADYFSRITNAIARITAMIQFTRTYESIGVHAPVWQDARTLVETAAQESHLGPVRLVNDLPDGTDVFADPLIVKAFYNLMENAVQYGETITFIRFSGEERGGEYRIICEDDGVGIPADEKEKIFLRGFGKNSGLGLFLAREILAITEITIKETGEPGKGARFEMTVPTGIYRFGSKP